MVRPCPALLKVTLEIETALVLDVGAKKGEEKQRFKHAKTTWL